MDAVEFRAWDYDDQKMVEVEELMFVGRLYLNNETSNFELMQYTTNKDRNGTKIFKGDLLRYNERTYEVVWHEDGWTVNGIYLHHIASEAEVIGNVFENEELKEVA